MKIWTIAWKDTLIRFRDRNALILMIAAPLILSLIIGSAFSGFISGSDPVPFDAIPVLIINEDTGEAGQQFVDTLSQGGLEDLLDLTEMDDLAAAREIVQLGDARAAIYIPETFTEAIQRAGGADADTETAQSIIQFYADPGATLTPNIVRGIVTQVVNGFNSAAISAEVTVAQVVPQAATLGPAMLDFADVLGEEIQDSVGNNDNGSGTAVQLNNISVIEPEEETTSDISPFAFFAPSMGMLFLMFSMIDGTRSILDEEREGTLARLLSTPTSHREILLGKIGGVFLTGILQFTVFVIASRFLFSLDWGSSFLGLVVMVLAVVISFTSLGALIAAFAKDVNQANIIGSAVTLTFAVLGGSFVPAQNYPAWLQQLSKITITRWGLDGFADLTLNGLGFSDILLESGVLFGFTAVLFALALWQFERRIAR